MPSLALGKLLSSSASKTNNNHDAPTKRSRGRSVSEKKPHEYTNSIPDSTSPLVDRSASDSYFSAVKKRTTGYGDNLIATDDYGFPVVDISQTPLPAEEFPEPSKPVFKGKCRTCDRSWQTTTAATYTCEQCSTQTPVGTLVARSDAERVPKPLSITKAQEVIENAITEGLKKIEERRRENSIAVPINTPVLVSPGATCRQPGMKLPQAFPGVHNRHTVLIPPHPPFQNSRRRGSAPDSEFSPMNEFLNSQQKPTLRRKSPGRLALNGVGRPSEDGNAILSLKQVSTPGPPPFPPPWITSTPSPKVLQESHHRRPRDPIRESFRPIFEYLSDSFRRDNLNISFSTIRKHHHGRSEGDYTGRDTSKWSQDMRTTTPPPPISQMDHKDLMIGDVYDVASSLVTARVSPPRKQQSNADPLVPKLVSQGSPHIDWKLVQKWYDAILSIGLKKKETNQTEDYDLEAAKPTPGQDSRHSQILEDLGVQIRNFLLDLTEQLITSPQKAAEDPEDIRYLLILLANPLLVNPSEYPVRPSRRARSATVPLKSDAHCSFPCQPSPSKKGTKSSWNPSKQARVISLILGTLTNISTDCHNHIVAWLSRSPEDAFRQQIDMLLHFINERVSIRHLDSRKPHKGKKSQTYNGVPTSQMFNDMLQSGVITSKEPKSQDWQLRSGCKVLQLFVRANDHYHRKSPGKKQASASSTRRRSLGRQLIPTEYFYNSQLDLEDKFNPRRDFDEWETKAPGFQLSQFPFLLTLGTKIQILEFDARKKMATKARQEFFDSLMRHTSVEKYFHLKIRRKCMIEDSLQRISEAINSSEEEAKKALKVHFEGEEGIDAGGLRKEWFLLLVKELLDPQVGLFLYNEETNYCYFNPNSLESSEQYQLVGAVLGLAIYNFTILDVPFPPFLFRKLAAAAPPTMGADLHQGWRPTWRPELADLAQLDPLLARNLQQILDYEGNVAEDIGAVFRIDTLQYGKVQPVSLLPGGGNRVVNKKNREEYVDLYVDFLLDKSVRRQFEPLARGFYNVCGGNALSLFRGEEIELLVRGASELNFSVLRGSALYENWHDSGSNSNSNSNSSSSSSSAPITKAAEVEARFPVVRWFWELMALSDVADQRRVLRWITGSDRIPATGMGGLVLRVQCLGGDCERLPQSRTCFNMLQLWNYGSRRTFIRKFWYAVVESEGFGLK